MHPEVRALADRFIYEQASLKHIIALLPEAGLLRHVPGSDWNVGQTLAHLAVSLEDYRLVIERWLSGTDPFEGVDVDAINTGTADLYASTSPDELLRLFAEGLLGLVAGLGSIPEDRTFSDLGHHPAPETLRRLCDHTITHATSLIDAVPEVRMDPLVLNWMLHAEFGDDEHRRWQAALLADAREHIAALTGGDEEEDNE